MAGKVTTRRGSAAVLGRRRFNTVEIFGAYGWQLNFDEIKWLLDWHLVRGTNLFFPHAAFYSIRGRRAFESEMQRAASNVAKIYAQGASRKLGDIDRILKFMRMAWQDSLRGESLAALVRSQLLFACFGENLRRIHVFIHVTALFHTTF